MSRGRILNFRVTDRDYAACKAIAAQAGKSVSAWVRELVLSKLGSPSLEERVQALEDRLRKDA